MTNKARNWGTRVLAATAVVILWSPAATMAAPPPANDSIAAATALTANPMSPTAPLPYSGNITGATGESGEPNHAGVALRSDCSSATAPDTGCLNSIWWTWTATSQGPVTVDTCGSDSTLHTVLAVYTGPVMSPAVTNLTAVASDVVAPSPGCPGEPFHSEVRFVAAASTKYYIAVAGAGAGTGASGGVAGHVTQEGTNSPPSNDNIASATPIAGTLPQTFMGSNVGATGEAGEPDHAGDSWGPAPASGTGQTPPSAPGACTNATTPTAGCESSVWWSYINTGATAAPTTVDTCGSTTNFDTTLAVYTSSGSPPSAQSLKEIAHNDNQADSSNCPSTRPLASSASFTAQPSTTYYIAVSGQGAVNTGTIGGELKAATGGNVPAAPLATTGSATLTATGVTLAGSVNPNNSQGEVAYYQFEYGTDMNLSGTTSKAPSALANAGTGTSNVLASAAIPLSALAPGTTYYYRLDAQNETTTPGNTTGTILDFTAPEAQTDPATNGTDQGATLNAHVNPGGANGVSSNYDYYFEYGTSMSYGSTTTQTSLNSSPPMTTTPSAAITGLSPGTLYHYHVVLVDHNNPATKINGADVTFTTPKAVTSSATMVSGSGARLGGTVNVGSFTTGTYDYEFQYGTTKTPYSSTTTQAVVPSGSGDQPVSFVASSLVPGTTYHFRVVMTDGTNPTDYGADMTFTTPKAVTTAASAISGGTAGMTNGTANLNATVNPGGLANEQYQFKYGLTASYGSTTPLTGITGSTDQAVTAPIIGLTPGQTYHYQVILSNSMDMTTTAGADSTFTVQTASTGAADGITVTSATLHGTVNDENLPGEQYQFQYGTTTAYGASTALTSAPASASDQNASATLSNLAPGATYHYRMVLTDGTNPTFGADATFTLQPDANTTGASGVFSTGATLNGTIDPQGAGATGTTYSYHFEYGTTPYSANTASVTTSGTGPISVNAQISGLTPGQTYHFRLDVTNTSVSPNETTTGNDITFVAVNPPTATTQAATAITGESAMLNGQSNPNGLATTYHFDFGQTTSYGTRIPVSEASVGSDSADHLLSQPAGGLSQGTTYNYRLVTTNANGTSSYGANRSFTAPKAVTVAASAINGSGALLNGTVNLEGNAGLSYQFQYGTSTQYGSTTTAVPVSGSGDQAAGTGVTGLTGGTQYHFRVVLTDGTNNTYGADMTFMTPKAVTGSPSAVTGTGATLNGTVNPEGLGNEQYQFQYGTSTNYGQTTMLAAASGASDQSVSATIGSLAPGTMYHFRVVLSDGTNTTLGNDATFTTPNVATTPATAITGNGATFNGSINPGGNSGLSYAFQYGATATYGSTTSATPISGVAPQAVSAVVNSLLPATTYHFRVILTDGTNTTYGTDQSLTTPKAVTSAATAITGGSAVLNGSVNPEGNPGLSYEFQYGTSTSYGSTTSPVAATGSVGGPDQSASAAVSSLTPGATYHFRVVLTDGQNPTYGPDQTFTTPNAITDPATSISGTGATLNGIVNPAGLAGEQSEFQYGTTTAYASTTAPANATGSGNQSVAATIGSLAADTTYHFRVVLTDGTNSVYGADTTFKTSPPVTLNPVASPTNTATPTLSGSAGTAAGDAAAIAIKIYSGPSASGTPVETLTATANGGMWSIVPSALSDGAYTAIAQQSDNSGNTATSSPATFIIDTAAPAVTLVAPSNGSTTNDNTPTLSGAAGTASGDLTAITVKVYLGASATGSPIQTLNTTASGGAWSVQTTQLTDGTYTAQASQPDNAGNTGTASSAFKVDTAVPKATITAGPPPFANNSNPSFSFSVDKPDSSFSCSIDGGQPTACTSPYVSPTLPDGTHTFAVHATDTVGNVGPDAKLSFTIDTSSPEAAIVAGPSGQIATTTTEFSFSATDPGGDPVAGFVCSIDGGAFFTCRSPTETPALRSGTHTFAVRAVDGAGNIGPTASTTFVIDVHPPTVKILKTSLSVTPRGELSVPVDCQAVDGCRGVVQLTTRMLGASGRQHIRAATITVGTARFGLPAGKAEINLQLSQAGRSLLAKLHKLRVAATILAKDPARRSGRTSATLNLI